MPKNPFVAIISTILFISNFSHAQTIGLINHSVGSEDSGYVLFAPFVSSDTVYMIDKCGRLYHKWATGTPNLLAYFLPDGSLLRTGKYPNPIFDPSHVSDGGLIERYDWDGNLMWHYILSDITQTQDHDVYYMPNGNLLLPVWEVIPRDTALDHGKMSSMLGANLWSAKLIEIKPIGTDSAEIVWVWRLWDHIIQEFNPTRENYGTVAMHPELVNLNYIDPTVYSFSISDWTHLNAVDYNPTLDQIMISAHNLNEIWIIDHSTTTEEAASHSGGKYGKGGDILYRWGNPAAYGRGTPSNKMLYQQHNPTWITSGKYKGDIMVFNNGLGRPGANASSIDIIKPPVDTAGNYFLGILPTDVYGPDSLIWTYEASTPSDFFTNYMGSAQMLPNGNILTCESVDGKFFEIDPVKNMVWEYINPVDSGKPDIQGTVISNSGNSVYRCMFYPTSFPGFATHTIAPGVLPIEGNPLPSTCTVPLNISKPVKANTALQLFPNPCYDELNIKSSEKIINVVITDIFGRAVYTSQFNNGNVSLDIKNIMPGMYFIRINNEQSLKFVKK
jgi:hypothetical protein